MKDFVKVVIIFSLLSLSCSLSRPIKVMEGKKYKSNSTLQKRLVNIADTGFAFGQQDGTAYGVNWYLNDGSNTLNSDIKKVSGELPAMIGFDLGHLEHGGIYNLDTVSFALIKQQTIEVDQLGGIISFSWHADNPVSQGSSWDTTPAVHKILYDKKINAKFNLWIERLSRFFKSLKDENNQSISVIFRPFHEMNGSWFWWGRGNCTNEDYVKLWQYTIERLRQHGVNNILTSFSPNTMNDIKDFEDFYPGDDYVDVLGVDIYNHNGNQNFIKSVEDNLSILRAKGEKSNKPFALTETGNVNMGKDSRWWTEILYPVLEDSGISWVLVWRNARKDHYFATFPNENSSEDFKTFVNKSQVLMLPDLRSKKL